MVWRTERRFLKKLNTELPYNPLLRIYSKEIKTVSSQRAISIPMFTATLFTIAKTWKQPVFINNGWTDKQNVVYPAVEHYSGISKRKGSLTLTTTRMHLEDIVLSKKGQSTKDKYRVVPLMRGTESRQVQRDWKGDDSRQCRGEGAKGSLMRGAFSFARWKVLEIGCTTVWRFWTQWNCTLRNGEYDAFHIMHIFTTINRIIGSSRSGPGQPGQPSAALKHARSAQHEPTRKCCILFTYLTEK